MKKLIAHAASLGVSVHVAHLPAPLRGVYDAARRMVVYDFNLTPIERRCVLAHELGHAFYDHRTRGDARSEEEADVYATRLLIRPSKLARLEEICSDPDWLAEELRVEPRFLDIFARKFLTRAGGATYAGARLGHGQYWHRSLSA